jgi:hypothetical protein
MGLPTTHAKITAPTIRTSRVTTRPARRQKFQKPQDTNARARLVGKGSDRPSSALVKLWHLAIDAIADAAAQRQKQENSPEMISQGEGTGRCGNGDEFGRLIITFGTEY